MAASAGPMSGSTEIRFLPDHPTAAGHFPGNPIIPGALLLDCVASAIANVETIAPPYALRAVKFLRPVRPGDRLRIEWHEERGLTQFQCVLVDAEQIAVSGTLRASSVAT